MINKVSESWNRIEKDVSEAAHETDDLEGILEEIHGVQAVLKKMCQVSVTRTSLKSAVREALMPIIAEHRDELFPEIAELRKRLEAAGEDPSVLDLYRGERQAELPDEFLTKLEDFEARIEKLADLETRFESDVSDLDERLRRDLRKAESRQDEKFAELKRDLDEELRSSVLSAEEKVGKVQEYLGRLEASIPETASAAAGEVEGRLRKEIESMVQQLTGKLDEVQDLLRRIENLVPHREIIQSLDQRLARLEGVLETLSQRVENVDSVAPELRGLGDRFTALRDQIDGVHQVLGRTTGEVRAALAARLDELQAVLRDGISRWEADQSQMQERLTHLRDSLRDQLVGLTEQVEKAEGSFWKKLGGKKDALKLSGEGFQELSGKLETIIGGLEAIIARRKSQS